MGLRAVIPWWAKIGAKIVLSRLPINYAVWRKAGVFRAGDMDEPDHAWKVFENHYARARSVCEIKPGFVCLELGPGDSLLSGIVARAFGASRSYLVDEHPLALQDPAVYHACIETFRKRGAKIPAVAPSDGLGVIMEQYGITYLTGGVEALRCIPGGEIDFAWSNVVLEHVARSRLLLLLKELRRIVRNDGVSSHAVDLRDHLGGRLNHLRFSEKWWEQPWMARSGFYTNRFRFSEMLALFQDAEFSPQTVHPTRWEELPTAKHKLADPFRQMDDQDLLVCEFDVVMTPR